MLVSIKKRYISFKRKKLYDKKYKSKRGEKIKKILQNKILNDLVTNSTVQSNIRTGNAQKPDRSKKRRLKKSDDKESSNDSSTSSDSSSNEDISELEQKLLKRYHAELKDLSLQSKKLNSELQKEKMKQKLLRKKLKETMRKQNKHKPDSSDSDSSHNNKGKSKSKYDQSNKLNQAIPKVNTLKKKAKHLEKLKQMLEKKTPKAESREISPLKEKMMEKLKAARLEKKTSKPESREILPLKEKMTEKLKAARLEKKTPKPESIEILPLKEKMMEKLKAARFRFLNEQIYTTPSKEAQKIFQKDPDAFRAYHDGYKQQVKTWPMNPLDVIIKTIKKMPLYLVVADFGCGEAKLAKSVKHKVYSFDLVAIDETVTACDMAHVPLQDSSVDVVIFCLSLMSTNLGDYLLEANRVLKIGGTVKIVEVVSRFENPDDFIKAIQLFGFKLLWKDLTQNYFYFMDFKKEQNIKDKKKLPTFKLHLQPCLYKKR